MAESPAASTPYEVLGVTPDASQAELRRAYRQLLRQTHPDTGGDPARFHAVQQAWARIGDSQNRGLWDSGGARSGSARFDSTQSGTASNATAAGFGGDSASRSGVRARSYGHPGGAAREIFLVLMREWAGRGAELSDPYDPALVRSAPKEIRHLLAQALAEEATARAVSGLGIGYTIWNGVETGHGKLHHIVLGPAGLFAIMSEDWGSQVRVVRGELVGDDIAHGAQPVRTLVRLARRMGRFARVRFTATIFVVPDDSLDEPIVHIGKKNDGAIVRLSILPMVLRDGLGGGQRLSIEDVFDVRTRLQQTVNFV